jgi:hypothetical protein
MSGAPGDAVFSGTVPVGPQGNETAMGGNFSIWMLSGMTPMSDGKTILGVFPALNEITTETLYSTMVQMEVVDPSSLPPGGNPPTARLGTGRLFYPSEVNYGTFGLVVGMAGYVYLLGSDLTGVKLARVADAGNATIADRNQYEYYNSATGAWQPQHALTLNDAAGNILDWNYTDPAGKTVGPNVGDVWYDAYHQTMVMLYLSYAMNNSIEGPWSKPVAVWTPPVLEQCGGNAASWNYQGHAHPGWDPSGKTLLVSYASCAMYVSFAMISWA